MCEIQKLVVNKQVSIRHSSRGHKAAASQFQRSVLRYFRPESQAMMAMVAPGNGPASKASAAARFAPVDQSSRAIDGVLR